MNSNSIQIRLPHTPSPWHIPSICSIPADENTTHIVKSSSFSSHTAPLLIDPFNGTVQVDKYTFCVSHFSAHKHALPNHITIHSRNEHITLSYCTSSNPSTANLLGQLTLFALSPPGCLLLKPLSVGVTSSIFLARHLSSGSLISMRITRSVDLRHLNLSTDTAKKAITIPSCDVPKHDSIHAFQEAFWHKDILYAASKSVNVLSASSYFRSMQDEDIGFSEVRKVIKDILSGLAHLHSHCIIHGNLVLPNIVIHRDESGSEQIKKAAITGFTHARSIKGNAYPENHKKCKYTRNKNVVPPEGLSSKSPSSAADVWAAGNILKYLMSLCEDEDDEESNQMFSLMSALLQPVARRRLTARAALEHPAFSKVHAHDDFDDRTTLSIDSSSSQELDITTKTKDPKDIFRNAVKKIVVMDCWRSVTSIIDSNMMDTPSTIASVA